MKRIAAALLFFFSCSWLSGQGLEDWYAALSQSSGIDNNAGLATFWTLVIPPGGMYQAMGTAYSAVLKDSGYLEANPAGSATLKETELSVYHNDWIADSRLESVVFTIRDKDLGLGFGTKLLYLPFTAINNWGERYQNSWSRDYAKGYYTEFVGTANAAYTFFGNYYFSGVTLGGNLKIAYRGVPESIATGQSALAIMADFGALTKFNFLKFYPSRDRNFSLAMVLKNIGPPVMDDPLPSSIVFGTAYSPVRPLTVSFDTTVPMSLSKDFSLGNLGAVSIGSSKVEQISFAAGMNLALTTFWAVQGGIELKPGRPRLTAGTTFTIDKLTMNVNYTVDLLTTLTPFDRISIEAKLNLGDLGRQELEDRARELYLNGLDSYAKGNLEEAVQEWQKALDMLPSFLPAKEMMETAKRAIELQKKMEESQKIQ